MVAANTGVFGSKADDEINSAWKLVEDRVIQMAGGDRSKINPNLNIDNVLQYLDQAQTTDKKAAEKYGDIKKIFHRTLQCIETVGGIVADGASYAFGPATTCYSALTFVISAWRGYEGIFESLASLLEKCTEFLDRLGYYAQSGMDTKLTKVACSHLQLFVEICDRSLKLKSKRHKLAAFVKQMFLNDDGVQDLLGAMQDLIDKEHGLVAAQTWKSSNDAAAYSKDGLNLTRKMHNSIVEDKNQLKRDKELEKCKKAIINALDLDQKLLQDDVPDWEKSWKRHKSKIIEGSGERLVNDELFKEWIAGTNHSSRILGLEGRDGAGKTLLAANIVLYLRRMKNVGSSRVVVAHNFLDPDPKSSTRTDTLMTMSKNLIFQLALSDEPYMKSVAAICEKSMSFESPMEMWNQLLLQNDDLRNIDVTFFLILDGLGSEVDGFTQVLKMFSDSSLIQKTRILVTGSENTFHKIRRVGGIDVEKIVLGEPNEDDIELYINYRMDNMEMLSDISRAHVSEMRKKILNSIMKSTLGDYYKVNRVLDNIATTDDVGEIHALLETAGDTRPDQIEAEIESLNEKRTSREISEINEIILWIWAGYHWLSPVQMEAALELKALNAGNPGGTSLLSMESKIKTKYTIFTVDYNGKVDFKVGEMLDKVPHKKNDTSDRDENSTSGFKAIQPAEINIVRHYLNAVCPPDLYKKFGFDEFFELKMVRKRNYIYQDRDNGHITMVIRCLTCLVEKRNEKTEMLLDYVTYALADHMHATDLSLADRSLKSEAGELLVRLFSEQYAIDSLLSLHPDKPPPGGIHYLITEAIGFWMFEEMALDLVSKWLNDSAVIEKVKDHPFVTSYKAKEANRGALLFQSALKTAASDLFINSTSKQARYRAFLLICYMLSKENKEFIFDTQTVVDTTLQMFQSVEKRAQEILGVTEKNSPWEGHAATLLLDLPGDQIPKSAVIETAKRALELDPNNWNASYALLRASGSNGDAGTLEDLVGKLKADAGWRAQQQNEEQLAQMLYELGDMYWEAEETREKAIAVYSQILELKRSISILEPFYKVLRNYTLKSKWAEIISFLEELLQSADDDQKISGTFIANGLAMDYFLFCPILSRAIEATGRLDLLESLMENAEARKADFDTNKWNTVKINRGIVFAEMKGHEEKAIDIWEQVIAENAVNGYTLPVRLSSEALVETCTTLVTAEGVPPEKLEAYDKKVRMCRDLLAADSTQPSVHYGPYPQYFNIRGKTETARKMVYGLSKQALEMLYDDDIENDELAFWNLSVIFSAMRDYENNEVAWHMMEQSLLAVRAQYEKRMQSWDEMKEAGHEPDESTKPEEPHTVMAFCDGDCDRVFTSPDGFWVCLVENGSKLYCEECYVLLQHGDLDMKLGGKCRDHEHQHMVQDKEKLATLPKGSVFVRDRVITLEEWKQEIKAKYLELD